MYSRSRKYKYVRVEDLASYCDVEAVAYLMVVARLPSIQIHMNLGSVAMVRMTPKRNHKTHSKELGSVDSCSVGPPLHWGVIVATVEVQELVSKGSRPRQRLSIVLKDWLHE